MTMTLAPANCANFAPATRLRATMVGASRVKQQRLVADVGGAMDRRIDAHRAGKPPAIAAA